MHKMSPHGYNEKSQKTRKTGYLKTCDCSGLPAFPPINIDPIGLVSMLSNNLSLTSLNVSSQEHACFITQSCLTFCHPRDCNPLDSSDHGILQARILEWVANSFSRGSSWPRDRTCVSCTGRWILYPWATWEALVEHDLNLQTEQDPAASLSLPNK